MNRINYYLKILLRIFVLNIKKAITYRANFFLSLFDSFIWFSISVIFFKSIYLYTDLIAGWNEHEILLLVGISELLKTFLFVFFIENLTRIPSLINNGNLDKYLCLPISVRFLISFEKIDIGNIGSFPLAIFLIIYSLSNVQWPNLIEIIFLFLSIIISLILCYSLWMIIICLSFWLKKLTGVSELFIGLLTFMRYPSQIFTGVLKILFLILFPIVVASNIPSEILLNKEILWINFLRLCVFAFTLFFVSTLIWNFALSKYESAGG